MIDLFEVQVCVGVVAQQKVYSLEKRASKVLSRLFRAETLEVKLYEKVHLIDVGS
jgi:hypothetical protein